MSETPPDFRVLARRYLDLWQEQVGQMVNDPALAQAVARSVALMAEAPVVFTQAAAAKSREAAHGQQAFDGKPFPEPQPSSQPGPHGTAAAAASPDESCGDSVVLARRVDELERRIAVLEAELGRRGGKLAAMPRRRRTRGVDPA